MKQNYGERIKKLRLSRDLTLEKFAKRIGVSKATVMNYEKNETFPDIATLERMVVEFGAGGHWLITGKGEMFLEKDGEGNGLPRMAAIKKLFPHTKIDGNLLEILEAAGDPILRNEMAIAVILAKQKYQAYFDKKEPEGKTGEKNER